MFTKAHDPASDTRLRPVQIEMREESWNENWIDRAIGIMSDKVYITLDLDVLDPGIMPSTGTPEPGGLSWETTLQFLKKVFELKDVKGFDIVELAPIKNLKAPDFLVAKLYYKMLSYKFKYNAS